MQRRLIVFARFPEPGKCKTRLARTLGPSEAHRVYLALLDHTLDVVRRSGIPSLLMATPDEAAANGPQWAPGAHAYAGQGGGDLGERLARAVRMARKEGAGKIVLIGTDCPQISERILTRAFNALDTNEVVLGPAQDGGYYLIGMREERPRLFAGIRWGSPQVLSQTREVLKKGKISYILLDTLIDVDTEDDLNEVRRLQSFL